MFGSGNGDWKEEYVEGTEEGRNRQNEIRVGEDVKTVYESCAGGAGTSLLFSAVVHCAISTTPEKSHYRRA